MFRWRRTLIAALRDHSNCAIRQHNTSKIVRREISISSNMGDKFKLPTRYGAGEKSVWWVYVLFGINSGLKYSKTS